MYQKILVPLDGSELAECVLSHVESIAKGCETKEVIFLHVIEPAHGEASDFEGVTQEDLEKAEAESIATVEKYLNQLSKRIRYEGVSITSRVISGASAESIADYAVKNSIDLIIMATHGRSGVRRSVWGSVADRTLRSVCVPVMMVRAPGCALDLSK